MDRRQFLSTFSAALAALGCQASPATRRAPSFVADDEALAGSRAIRVEPANDATTIGEAVIEVRPSPTARALIEQSRITPIPRDRPVAYTTRTIPPERLVIPTIGLDAKVVTLDTRLDKGTLVWETAAFAVGHHRGTANPGDTGNIVLSGHISSPNEGAIFKRLTEIKPGDGVVVITSQQHFMYVAREIQVVRPTAIEFLNPTVNAVATLITCVPDGVYSHRLIVRCDAV